MKKAKMLCLDALLLLVLLGLDQFTKRLAVLYLKEKPAVPLLKGVLEFQYLENRGAAFGMLKDQKVFILFVGVVFVCLLLYLLVKLPDQKKYRAVHILFTGIIAGGIGNMFDRFRLQYVVDFIYFVPIDFPVFNLADTYVVLATVGLFILFLFVYQEKDLEFLSFKQKKYREMK
ncbi:MAG: signal peptidase II [Clostridium sp.]|jgi:signal peptidase II|nr:signal peptidase II [Clostridium sp.]